jgi:hypothetical protein
VVHSSNFSSEAGTRKHPTKNTNSPYQFSTLEWLQTFFGLARVWGIPITSIQQQTSRKLIDLLKIHKRTKGFCIVLPTEDGVNKSCLALKLGFVSNSHDPSEVVKSETLPHHPTQNTV